MPIKRSLHRNILFYDAGNPDVLLGGLIQNGSITDANFLDILEVLIACDKEVEVKERRSQQLVRRRGLPLQLGEYKIHSKGIYYIFPIN